MDRFWRPKDRTWKTGGQVWEVKQKVMASDRPTGGEGWGGRGQLCCMKTCEKSGGKKGGGGSVRCRRRGEWFRLISAFWQTTTPGPLLLSSRCRSYKSRRQTISVAAPTRADCSAKSCRSYKSRLHRRSCHSHKSRLFCKSCRSYKSRLHHFHFLRKLIPPRPSLLDHHGGHCV